MYEPYPVPEQVREQKLSRYSSLWTFAKQDLRLLLFSNYCRFSRFRPWVFLELYFYRLRGVFTLQLRSLYLVNDWIANKPYDVPPNLNGIWGIII